MAEGSGNETISLNDETEMRDELLQGSSHPVLGNEIVPLTSETQIALPSTGDGSLVAPTQSEVVIAGGNYVGAVIGPQTNKKVLKAYDNRNAKITNIHHHHYPANEGSQESPSTSNATGARPKQRPKPASQEGSNTTGAKMKQSPPEGCVKICSDIFMFNKKPLKRGTNVYEGYQKHASGSKVRLAIKRISPYDDKNLREVGHLASLASHPNIVRIIRSKTRKGIVPELYIAMELCSSQTLQDYLKENYEKNIPFDFDQTLTFTKQLVSVIKHIHQNKIAHRDLKPENILLSLDGEQIKVSDFGISKEIRDGNTTKQTSLGEGTDGYRAPETFKSEDISQSADIFSLGLVMYPMWSNGKHAFGGDVHMRNPNIINNKGRDLSGLLISGTKKNQLRNLIDWMLQPDPQKRPTIEQVAEHAFFKSGPSPAAEDPNNRSNLRQQPVEKSSLKPSANEKTLSESFQSALHFQSASKQADSKEDSSNKASSSQQRGMKPSSLRKPTNEDKLTEQSRSILHHTSAANIPPPTPDPSNRSKLRQQPVERSSPKRPANVKTLTERFQSALRLPSASKKVASKEDPNNRSNLRQLPVEEAPTKRSTNETTLPERFQSALRIPSTSKQVPFKEGIVIFDEMSKHLQLFNPSDNTLKQMQSYNDYMRKLHYTAVTLHDYIYVVMQNKSVFRLKFSDERATWERMPDMIDGHGWQPPATVMSGSIYVAGGSAIETNAVEKFDPSSNKWSSLKKKKMVTGYTALVVAQGLIYSIGGMSKEEVVLKEVERFDPASSTWTFVAPMEQARYVPAAVEFNGKIFVLGGYNGFHGILSSVEIYDPSTNVWSAMKNNMLKPRCYYSAFVINGDIYAVGGDMQDNSVERYSSEKDVWEEVLIQTEREIRIRTSTKIQI